MKIGPCKDETTLYIVFLPIPFVLFGTFYMAFEIGTNSVTEDAILLLALILLRLVRYLHRMDILGLYFSFLILLTYLVEHRIWVVAHLFLLRLSPLILLDLLMWDKQQRATGVYLGQWVLHLHHLVVLKFTAATPILMRLHLK